MNRDEGKARQSKRMNSRDTEYAIVWHCEHLLQCAVMLWVLSRI